MPPRWNSTQKRERKAIRKEIKEWLACNGWVDSLEPIGEDALSKAWTDIRFARSWRKSVVTVMENS